MRRALGLLLATLLLAACGTVGDVLKKTGQVLMDPSIQVGSTADQPTQIALSLYAGRDVNPNPESAMPELRQPETALPQTEPAPETQESPYAIRLNGSSPAELTENLRILLAHLQETPAAPSPGLPLERRKAEAPPSLGSLVPKPLMSLPGAAQPAPLPPPSTAQRKPQELAPGQYQTGAVLPDMPSVQPPASDLATPIAFKVLQLKDDSMLLNASAEQLWSETRKALGSTYLSIDDYVLLPGQFKFINFRPIDADANYIAVVANFRDPDTSVWKQVFRVTPRGERHALLISFLGKRVAITDERYPPAQPSQSSRKP